MKMILLFIFQYDTRGTPIKKISKNSPVEDAMPERLPQAKLTATEESWGLCKANVKTKQKDYVQVVNMKVYQDSIIPGKIAKRIPV